MRRLWLATLALLVCGLAQAAVTTTLNSQTYACDGATTGFPITFPFMAGSDLVVTNTNAVGSVLNLSLGTDYTVTGGNDAVGTLTTTGAASPCASGNTLTITRAMSVTQPTSLSPQGQYRPKTHETAWDRLTMIAQQQSACAAQRLSNLEGGVIIGGAGPAGPVGMTWRGAWSSTYPYAPNDVVGYLGSSYIAVSPNTNLAPPSVAWNLLTQFSGFTTNNTWSGTNTFTNTIVVPPPLAGSTQAATAAYVDAGTASAKSYTDGKVAKPTGVAASNPGSGWTITNLISYKLPGNLIKVSGYATSGSGTFVATLPYAPPALTYFVGLDVQGGAFNGASVDASGNMNLTTNATGGHNYYFEISYMGQ